MSDLNPRVFLTDLTLTPGNTLSEPTISFNDTLDLDRAGTMGLSVLLGTFGANTILTARPPRGNLPPAQMRLQPRPVLARFSFSGRIDEIDHQCMIMKVSVNASSQAPSVGFDNDDLVIGLASNQIDEMVVVNVPFYDLLNGLPGEILAKSDSSHSTGLLPEGTPIHWLKGILRTTIGNNEWPQRSLLDWQGILTPQLHQMPTSAAFNGDTLLKALELAAKRVAGLNLGDGSLPGTLGHLIFDTSSPSLNIGSELDSVDNKPTVTIGYLPTSVFMDIVQGADPNAQDIIAPVGDNMLTATDLSAMFAQLEITGGKASQGLPVNAQITSGVILNKNLYAAQSTGLLPGSGITGGGPPTPGLTPGSIAGQQPSESSMASLPVVGVFIPPYGGGAYYYPGDGAYYQLGSCPGIKELLYDEQTDMLYAATIYGVRQHRGNALDNLTWDKVGKLRYPVDRIWLHRVKVGGLSYFWVFAQVNAGQAGVDGIWSYPPLSGVEDEDAPGWGRMLNQPKITAFTPIPGTLNCVFVIGDRPYQVLPFGPLSSPSNVPANVGTAIDMPQFENVIRLDPGPVGHYFVLTGAGSKGLYMDGNSINLNPGSAAVGSLRDIDGQPIFVNRMIAYEDHQGTINGRKVAAIACTNRGLWFTDVLTGTGWSPLNGQSGLAGQDIQYAMVGGIRRIIDRDSQEIYAFNGSEMFTSFSGGLWWHKTVGLPLDIGTAFNQLAVPARLSPNDPLQFADWDVTAVGTGVNPAPGFVVAPSSTAVQLPDGWQLARRLTATNSITYRIVNTHCTAPYFGIETVAVSDIYSGVEIDQALAEQSLISVGCELLYNASQPQTLLTIPTWFNVTNAKLRTLRQGHLITLTFKGTIIRLDPATGTPISTEYAEYDHERFYVLAVSRRMNDGSSTCDVQLTVGKFLMTTPATGDELAANLLYSFKNDRRYGVP